MINAIIRIGEVITPWINATNSEFYMDLGFLMFGFGVMMMVICKLLGKRAGIEQSISRRPPEDGGFTLLELLTVMAIIVVLAALILAGLGHAQQKSARERTMAEIAAISTCLEAYKIDNGDYPRGPDNDTDVATDKPKELTIGILSYYLTGKDAIANSPERNYLEFKKDSFSTATTGIPRRKADGQIETIQVKYIIDPFGNPYGYATGGTYNPTFDLWSTAGTTATTDQVKWITNW